MGHSAHFGLPHERWNVSLKKEVSHLREATGGLLLFRTYIVSHNWQAVAVTPNSSIPLRRVPIKDETRVFLACVL